MGAKHKAKPIYLDESLICLNLDAPDKEAVIHKLAALLSACGAVGPEYGRAACERELRFPTGLPTRGVCVAIPHADPEHVRFSALALATCASPVVFGNMGNPDEALPVELVIMLAIADGKEQVRVLRQLAEAFGEPTILQALRTAGTPEAVIRILREQVLAPPAG